MTAPGQVADPSPGRLAKWRDRLLGIASVLVLGTAAWHMFFVAPRYRVVFDGVGAVPSAPARLALAASRLGLVIFAAVVLGGGAAWWKERRGKPGLFALALSVVALLSAVYLVLISFLYSDLARVMERIR
jgi:hypothetical protein